MDKENLSIKKDGMKEEIIILREIIKILDKSIHNPRLPTPPSVSKINKHLNNMRSIEQMQKK